MFDQYQTTQPIADRLKALVDNCPAPLDERRAAIEMIQRFENVPLLPDRFEAALDSRLSLVNDTIVFTGQPADVPFAVGFTLGRYLFSMR